MQTVIIQLEQIGRCENKYLRLMVDVDVSTMGEIALNKHTVLIFGSSNVWLRRRQRPDWFAWLDNLVANMDLTAAVERKMEQDQLWQ